MARIVCQVLHRANRITFLWSEGTASFEPYHLEGAERENLIQLAAQAHADLASGNAPTQVGHQLYRAVFRLDAPESAAAAGVRAWLAEQAQGGKIERLEFLSDVPGLIPWNVLLDDPVADATQFWGVRFNLGSGRRVNILRQNPVQVEPKQLLAADDDLVDLLSDAQRPALNPLREAGKLVHTASALADTLAKSAPDVLLLLVRCVHGRLRLGDEPFDPVDLQRWLEAPTEGNPDPLVILMGVGEPGQQPAWLSIISEATSKFGGLVANEVLLPAASAFAIGQALAERFVQGPTSVGEVLQALRRETGTAALAFSAFCPPGLHVAKEDATEPAPETSAAPLPLPRLPYRPFAAFEASDRPLFFGRENDTLHGAQLADQPDTCGILLHGAPSVGKTSYLQAGLLPFLEQDSVGYRVLRDRSPADAPLAEADYPPLLLRATSDLAGQFADALCVFCAQPYTYTTPTGTHVTLDLPNVLKQVASGKPAAPTSAASSTAIQSSASTDAITVTPSASPDESDAFSPQELWVALRDDPGLLGKILDAITRSLPFELLIVVDQGEELVTLVSNKQQIERRRKAVEMLAALADAAPRCKIVMAIRSQTLAEFLSLWPDGKAPPAWRSFFLPPLTEADLVAALQLPTNREEVPYTSEIPSEKFFFAFEEGMAHQIATEAIDAAAADQQSPLPVIQAVGALLYQNQVLGKKQSVLRVTDLKEFGGVKGALEKALDQSLDGLGLAKASKKALRRLITILHTSRADGTVSRDLVPASELQSHWAGASEPVEPVVNKAADEAGLFEIQQLMIGGRTGIYVSLAQDSLAQLGRKMDREKDLEAYGWGRMVDTLWIMIPFAFLCAVVSWFVTGQYMRQGLDAELEERAKDLSKKEKDIALESAEKATKAAYATVTRRPLYYGLIARADQALRTDNALRARQILREEPASRHLFEETKDYKLPDLRGFEWRYLWKHLHSERFLLPGHRSAVTSVATSPDGKHAATAGLRGDQPDDAAVRIWNLETGEELARLVGPKTRVNAIAFSPDGKTLACGCDDKLVRLWDLSNLKTDFVRLDKESRTLEGHDGPVNAVAFGKDDKTLASAGADKAVILWDMSAGKAKHTLKEHAAAVQALAFSSDGKTLASAGAEASVILWDAEAGKKRQAISTPFRSIAALSMAPDGKTLATGGVESKFGVDAGAVRFFDVADGKETRAAIPHSTGVGAVAFRPDGDAVASGGNDHIVRLWNIKSSKEERKWVGHYGAITSLAFAKDAAALVSAGVDAQVKVWNPEQSSGPDVIKAHADWVQCLALNGKNDLLASGSRDGSVKLWNPSDAKLLLNLPQHAGAVTAVAFSNHKDAAYLAVSTRNDQNDGAIQIWLLEGDIKKGFKAVDKRLLKGHQKGVTCLAFHPLPENANVLVSGSADRTVKYWDIDTGKETHFHEGHKEEVRCLAFTADGGVVASGGKDGLVCLYDALHKELWTLKDLHADSIESVAHVPLPQFRGAEAQDLVEAILTGGNDRTLRFWAYIKEGQGKTKHAEKGLFRSHGQAVTGIAYNFKTNPAILTSSLDGTVKLFEMLIDENVRLLGNERYTFQGHDGAVRAVVFAADQSFLVSAGNDGTIRIWRAFTEPETQKAAGK